MPNLTIGSVTMNGNFTTLDNDGVQIGKQTQVKRCQPLVGRKMMA